MIPNEASGGVAMKRMLILVAPEWINDILRFKNRSIKSYQLKINKFAINH